MKTFGTLKHDGGAWLIDAEPHVVIKLKRVFPKIAKSVHGSIKLSDTLENCRELEWFLKRYPLDVETAASCHLARRADAHRDEETYISDLVGGSRCAMDFDLAIPARDYQRVAADLVLKQGGLLLADELGLGKTLVGICLASVATARPALVVTLTSLPRQWAKEFAKFTPGLKTHILKQGKPYSLAPKSRRRGQLALTLVEDETPDVIITSYSKLSGWAEVLGSMVRSVIFDEAQELRRQGSDKYEAAKHIAERCRYRLGLTATPIYNYGDEIFNVIDALRPGTLGSKFEFLQEWTTGEDNRGRASIQKPAAFGTYVRDQALMLRRTRADVGRELPPLTRVMHTIESDAAQFDNVESAATDLARIVLEKGGSKPIEKMQAAGEFDMLMRQATGIAKAPYVAEFVRILCESGERVLLFGWHRACYDIWLERLADLSPVMFTGSESPNQKQAAFEAFTRGDSKLLIMSLRSGAGLDGLQSCCRTLVFGELDWSQGVHFQCEARPHRDGQTDPVVAYYLVSEDGSDPIVADVLGIKSDQLTGILDPNAPLFEKLQSAGDHVKRLAEAYLNRKGIAA